MKKTKFAFILARIDGCRKRLLGPGAAGGRLAVSVATDRTIWLFFLMPLRHVLAAALVLAVPSLTHALDSPIYSGVNFPDIVGKALSGADIAVGMRDGFPKVVVMTFTRAAAKSGQAWLEGCRADETTRALPAPTPAAQGSTTPPPLSVVCYDVRMTMSLPPLVRGYVEGQMKKGQKPENLAQVVLVYKDKDAWRDRMAVILDNQDEPFIIMVDRQGRVQSLLHGAFDPAALKAEQAKLVAK